MSIIETIKKLFIKKDNLVESNTKNEESYENRILKINDTVIVKENVLFPEDESLCIAGWKGKIIEIDVEDAVEKFVTVKWDAETLKQIPEFYIKQSLIEGLDFETLILDLNDVKYYKYKFDEKERQKIASDLDKKFRWFSEGEEGERILKVIENVDYDNYNELYKRWNDYLKQKLTFPFKAIITDCEDNSKFRQDDKVIVKAIKKIDPHLGIIVDIEHKKKKHQFPLCDLEVINDKSPNYEPLSDYCYWFCNR